ncbi:hypothetical protein BO86DRAFT_327085 [Aspergillus japonicus CBS 114.51]|uniref:ABM domain-containing protein n=2 Tax=Aspergillus TaxID=5052 RepID=A0A2V5GPG2_ASPV1|nr:hypothetical protein BO86DRAFT_327085 [Aspergillus japonicus CBS 114.51]PYI12919.1 hypothetical protein BO99DRAFT_348716 [Aspergillus violaceofuscus CBS 115571]RAH75896.1 hypothetical protein BO86DRAFT_327085 [Aspergillus japonicus CBS 114.51]
MTEIHLIATLRPKTGKESQLRDILRETTSHVTLVEKQCLSFLLTEMTDGNGRVMVKVIERWATAEALICHQQRDWLKSMYRRFEVEELLEGPEIIENLLFVDGFVSR